MSRRPDAEPQSVAVLERRLDDGWERIEDARRNGQDVSAWEEFWIDLLDQYEAASDALDPVGQGETT